MNLKQNQQSLLFRAGKSEYFLSHSYICRLLYEMGLAFLYIQLDPPIRQWLGNLLDIHKGQLGEREGRSSRHYCLKPSESEKIYVHARWKGKNSWHNKQKLEVDYLKISVSNNYVYGQWHDLNGKTNIFS